MSMEAARPQVRVGARAGRRLGPRLTPYLMLAPLLLGLIVLVYYPLATTFWLSLHRYFWNKPQRGITFVGFENFETVFTDALFWQALGNTVRFMLVSTTLCMLIGLGLAVLLDRAFRGRNLVISLILMPTMIAPIVAGLTWKFLFDGQYGAVNFFMRLFGIGDQAWLSDPNLAIWAIITADVWQWSPFVFLVLLAGLQSLPSEPVEAARIDGASAWQLFRYITLPLLMPTFLLVLVIRLMDTFRVFDFIYLMTNGGPAGTTTTLGFLLYERTFRHFDMGQGAVYALIVLVCVLAMSLYFIRQLLRQVRDQG